MPALFVPEEKWGPRSWAVNHPLTITAQIHHGLVEAEYGYWGFSPANVPEGGYTEYGVDALGMRPDGYKSNNDNTLVDRGFGDCPGREPQPDPAPSAYTNGVVTPHAAFLALRWAPDAVMENLANLEADFDIYDRLGLPRLGQRRYRRRLGLRTCRSTRGSSWPPSAMPSPTTCCATRSPRKEFRKVLRPVIGMETFNAGPRSAADFSPIRDDPEPSSGDGEATRRRRSRSGRPARPGSPGSRRAAPRPSATVPAGAGHAATARRRPGGARPWPGHGRLVAGRGGRRLSRPSRAGGRRTVRADRPAHRRPAGGPARAVPGHDRARPAPRPGTPSRACSTIEAEGAQLSPPVTAAPGPERRLGRRSASTPAGSSGRVAPAVAADHRLRAPRAAAPRRRPGRPRRRRRAGRGVPDRAPASSASRPCGRTPSSTTRWASTATRGGGPVHDFAKVDAVLDRLLETGLRPIVELSYMPRDLASDPSATVFDYRGIISPPRDEERWAALVRDLVTPPRRALRTRDGARLGVRGLERAEPVPLLVGAPSPTTFGCTRSAPGPSSRSTRAAGRWPGDGGGGLDRRPARVRPGRRRAARLHLDPHVRHAAARPAADRRALRALRPPVVVDRVGRQLGPRQADQRQRLGRAARRARACARRPAGSMRSPTGSRRTTSSSSGEAPTLFHGGFGLLTIGNLRKPRFWAIALLERLGDDELAIETDGRRRGLAGRGLGVPRRRRPGGDRGLERHAGPVEGGRRPSPRPSRSRWPSRGWPPGTLRAAPRPGRRRALEHHPHLGAARPPGLAGRGRLGRACGRPTTSTRSSRPARCGPTAGRGRADLRPADAGDVAPRARARRSSAGACRPSLSVGQPLAAELRNGTGLAIELLENGSVFAIRHGAILVNQVLGSPAGGRHRQPLPAPADARAVSRPSRCSGRRSTQRFRAVGRRGRMGGLVRRPRLHLHAAARAPAGRVVLDGPAGQHDGAGGCSVDAVLAQDLGLAARGSGPEQRAVHEPVHRPHDPRGRADLGFLICLAPEPAPGRGVSRGSCTAASMARSAT